MSSLDRQDGQTLVELLVAISMAMIIALAAFSLLEVTMRRTDETQGRVQSAQHGRLAMDVITRELRSAVCVSATQPAMHPPTGFPRADSNTASFFVDFTDDSAPTTTAPQVHVIAYDSATQRLVERDYTGTSDGATPPTYTYTPTGTPSRTLTLLDHVVPYRAPGATVDTPIFQYYGYDSSTPPRPDQALTPGATGLSDADLADVARIDITFRAQPEHVLPNGRGSTVFQDEVYVRAADPNDDAPSPACS